MMSDQDLMTLHNKIVASRPNLSLYKNEVYKLYPHLIQAKITPEMLLAYIIQESNNPKPAQRRDVTLDKIKDLRVYGYNYSEIASILGVSTKTIYNRLKEAGIDPKTLPVKHQAAQAAHPKPTLKNQPVDDLVFRRT